MNLKAFFVVPDVLSLIGIFEESQSGSRALRLTEDVWHQKYEYKKEGFQSYLKYSSKF